MFDHRNSLYSYPSRTVWDGGGFRARHAPMSFWLWQYWRAQLGVRPTRGDRSLRRTTCSGGRAFVPPVRGSVLIGSRFSGLPAIGAAAILMMTDIACAQTYPPPTTPPDIRYLIQHAGEPRRVPHERISFSRRRA